MSAFRKVTRSAPAKREQPNKHQTSARRSTSGAEGILVGDLEAWLQALPPIKATFASGAPSEAQPARE
jgi:hypothetical protein